MLLPTITITQATRRGWLAAKFKYHKGLIDVVKRLPIRRFVPESKSWEFDPSTVAVQMLEGTGAPIELDPVVREFWLERGGSERQETRSEKPTEKDLLELSFNLQLPASASPKGVVPPDFTFITLPHAKQAEAFLHIVANPKLYFGMETGTGKTKLYVDAARFASYLLKRPVTVLFIGPNNKVPDYRRELRTHAGKEGTDWLWWDARGGAAKWERALNALKQHPLKQRGLLVVGLNWESLHTRTQGIRPDAFDVILADELHNAKNPTSQAGAACRRLVEASPFAYGGSGTPCPQGPFDLWNQVGMLKPGLLPSTFAGHRKRYGILELAEVNGRKFQQVMGYQNLDELARAFNKVSFRALLKECSDLPPVITERRYVTMAPEHEAIYRTILKDGLVMLGPGAQCVVENAALALLRARQVCGGFLAMTDLDGKPTGRSEAILPNRKLLYLTNELLPDLYYSRTDRQVVVWAYMRAEVQAILAALRAQPLKLPDGSLRQLRVAELWGDTPKKDRDALDASFRAGEYDILVSNPQSGSEGLEFQTADREIFYSRDFNLKYRLQAGGRLQRIGQTRQVIRIDLLYENTVEDYVLDALEAKEDLQARLTRNPKQVLREAFNVEN